jgi:hypothetical protein
MRARAGAPRRRPVFVARRRAAARVLRDTAAGQRQAGVAQGGSELGQAALDGGARRRQIDAEIDSRLAAIERDPDRDRAGLGRVEMELGLAARRPSRARSPGRRRQRRNRPSRSASPK